MRIPYYGNETKKTLVVRIIKHILPSVGELGAKKFRDACISLTIEEIKQLATDKFGIFWYDDLASVKRKAKESIELAAVRMDHRVFNTGGNSTVVYEEKKEETTAWDAAGRPDDITPYKYMRIEQRRLEILYNTTITPLQAAQSIRQTIDNWDNNISYYREFYRLVGKAKVEVATTYEEVILQRDKAIESLDALT